MKFELLTAHGQQHSFWTHERMFLWKCQSFWDRKCLDPRRTRTPNPLINGECCNHLSYQGQTFAVTFSKSTSCHHQDGPAYSVFCLMTPFWACPHHYSPPILVRISKFGQQMHFSSLKIPGNSGLDWPWTSPSFLIPRLIYLYICDGGRWDCETVPGLFQCCSGTVSQSLHQCTWGTHSQSGMGPLVL